MTISHEAHVLAEREAFEAWVDKPQYLQRFETGKYAGQYCNPHMEIRFEGWMARAALSTADAERREMAGLMREAAVLVHRVTRFGSPGIGFYCRLCEGREVDYHSDVQHGHHCLVTKLRQAADRAEGK